MAVDAMNDLFATAPVAHIVDRNAHLSPCRKYRYALWRRWGEGRQAMFIGLNPSTADETADDPTIRRCIAFARDWGYDALCMANLFAFRATEPADMLAQDDPIGPQNDEYLLRLAGESGVVVAAWGTHGVHRGRDAAVLSMLPKVHYLRLTKEGHPGHPLYLPASLKPLEFAKAAPVDQLTREAQELGVGYGAEPHEVIVTGLRAKVAALESEVARLRGRVEKEYLICETVMEERDKLKAIADQPKGKDNRVREVLQSVHLYLSKPVETRGDGKGLLDSVTAAARYCGAPDSITDKEQREFVHRRL